MKRIFPCLAVAFPLIFCAVVLAAIQTFTMEYSYFANELDSRNSCRAIATEQLKRELLERLGTYVESKTLVRDQQLDKDSIVTLSAGIVQIVPLEEKWDGKEYWLKAQLKADPDEVAASINKLKNDEQLAKELEESRAQAAQAIEELTALKQQLAMSVDNQEQQEQYNEAVNRLSASDSFERGSVYAVAGNDEEAVKAYDQAIRFYPDDGKTYINRSIVLVRMGQYDRAADDLQKASALSPAKETVYYQRIVKQRSARDLRVSSVRPPDQPSRSAVRNNDSLSRLLEKKREEQKRSAKQEPVPRAFSIHGGAATSPALKMSGYGQGVPAPAPARIQTVPASPAKSPASYVRPAVPPAPSGKYSIQGKPTGTVSGSAGEYRRRQPTPPPPQKQKIAQPSPTPRQERDVRRQQRVNEIQQSKEQNRQGGRSTSSHGR